MYIINNIQTKSYNIRKANSHVRMKIKVLQAKTKVIATFLF